MKPTTQDLKAATRIYRRERARLKRLIKRDYRPDGTKKDGRYGYTDGNWVLALAQLEKLGVKGIANALLVARTYPEHFKVVKDRIEFKKEPK